MKNLFPFLLSILLILTACNTSNVESNFESNFLNKILELKNREQFDNDEQSVFNFYNKAIRFNSNGSYQIFDDNYNQSEKWISPKLTFENLGTWEIEGTSLKIFTKKSDSIVLNWEVKRLLGNSLNISDHRLNETIDFQLVISDKQDEL